MMRIHRIVKLNEYNGYALYQGDKSPNGAHGEILDALSRAMDSMTSVRRWTFVFSLTLNFPENYPPQEDNRLLMMFLRRFAERLRQKGACEYVWCREQNKGMHPHFHIAFFVNGDRIYHGWAWKFEAANTWGYLLGIMLDQYDGLVQISCPEAMHNRFEPAYGLLVAYGMMIDAQAVDVRDRKAEVYRWVSYLAKVFSKSSTPRCRSYGASRF